MRLHLSVLIAVIFAARLQAQPHDRALARIAFGSCAQQKRPQPIWDAIGAAKPDLFLFLGDTVYGDTEDMAVLRAKYANLAAMPGYQKLVKTCPILATWDDHDYGVDDGGADYPKRKESQQVFLDFFGVSKDSPRRKQEGVYHAPLFGPPGKRIQVILLDTRYFRSPLKKRGRSFPDGPYVADETAASTFLGATQWKWLEEQLRVPADLRLLCSSIQVIAEDHGWEKWMNFPHERARLFTLLRDTRAGGVIVLSGDRHLAELSMMDAGLGYPLYDLTSSGLNQAFKRWRKQEENRHRVATMNFGDNFGMIAVDWDRPDALVRMQIRDVVGEVIIQQKIPLSLLQPGKLKTRASGLARLVDGPELNPVELKKHLDKKRTIEMDVQFTGMGFKLIFLNSSADRLSEDNFTVVLDEDAQAKLKNGGIKSVRKHFSGKTIRVTGTITLFRNRPQIVVSDPGQIQIVARP